MTAVAFSRSFFMGFAALLLSPALAWAGEAQPPAAQPCDVEQGNKLYLRYCSACHGEKGKGDGVVSQLMRPMPTDLTQLAKKAGGTFKVADVRATIDGRETMRAHGDPNMPVWGDILTAEEGPALDRETVARTKVVLITDYLGSIQAK